MLGARLQASERRLDSLAAEQAPRLANVTSELKRIDAARPELKEVQTLMTSLENRARELRATWMRESLDR